jgi:outer membrane murein-binding lipoprotein Lpp
MQTITEHDAELVEQLAALIAYVENDRTAFCAEVQPARRLLADRAERLGNAGEAAGWAPGWMSAGDEHG